MDPGAGDPEQLTDQAAEFLAIPYVLLLETSEGSDGSWRYRARYPEMPGCIAEADTAVDAIQALEASRIRSTVELLVAGEEPPAPRPPLSYPFSPSHPWLVERAASTPNSQRR